MSFSGLRPSPEHHAELWACGPSVLGVGKGGLQHRLRGTIKISYWHIFKIMTSKSEPYLLAITHMVNMIKYFAI